MGIHNFCHKNLLKLSSLNLSDLLKIKETCLREAGLLEFQQNSNSELNPQEMIHNQVDKLLYDKKKWEFNKKRLKLGSTLNYFQSK